MSEGWHSSESAADSQKKSASPWDSDSGKDESENKIVRSGWGDNVSPLVLNLPPVNNGIDGPDPNQNGGQGKKPWRAGQQVAPAARNVGQEASPWQAPGSVRPSYPDSSFKGPGTEASSPDLGWRPSYPDSTYKGPANDAVPSVTATPWDKPGRTTYPTSTYQPDAEPPPDAKPNQNNGGGLDWRKFAEQQMQQQPQQQRGQGPFASPFAGPSPGSGGPNPISDQQRQYIEKSLNVNTSVFGHLATGAGVGGAMGAAEWMLDKHLLSQIGKDQVSGLGAWWQKYSPMLKQQEAYAKRLAEAEGAVSARVGAGTLMTTALNESALKVHSLLSGVDARVAADDALKGLIVTEGRIFDGTRLVSAAEAQLGKEAAAAMAAKVSALDPAQRLLLRQQSFMANALNITNPEKVAAVIGTEAELAAGTKLFLKGGEEAAQLAQFAKLSADNTKAITAAKLAEAELERSRVMLKEATDAGAGSLGGKTFSGATKGLAVAGATLAAGYGLDYLGSKMFGYKPPETNSTFTMLMDGVAVPSILLSNMPTRWKAGLAGTAFFSSRAAELIGGTGLFSNSAAVSKLLRPNIVDAVGVTAAALAPLDPKTKALAVGGAYLAGRAWNGVARLTGLDSSVGAELRDNSINAFSHDQLTASKSSFENAVSKAVALGKENEAALELQMRDWLSKQSSTNVATHMRGTAAIAAGLGQFRLEEGSRLDLNSHADKKSRILKGYNFDFGGEATTWLRMSAGSLAALQQFAQTNKGKTVDGVTMDDAYIAQLKAHQTKVEQQLDLIYGKHDLKDIFKVLKEQARVNSGDMQQALVRMKGQFDVISSRDTRFVAKSARDLAIGYLAEAAYMAERNNGEQARIMFQAASQYLNMSKQLDPKASDDHKQLDDIQREVMNGVPGARPSIPQALDKQYESRWNNPFELSTPKYPDLSPKK